MQTYRGKIVVFSLMHSFTLYQPFFIHNKKLKLLRCILAQTMASWDSTASSLPLYSTVLQVFLTWEHIEHMKKNECCSFHDESTLSSLFYPFLSPFSSPFWVKVDLGCLVRVYIAFCFLSFSSWELEWEWWSCQKNIIRFSQCSIHTEFCWNLAEFICN